MPWDPKLSETGNSYKNACIRGIQEFHHSPGDSSPAQIELFATTQSEIVSLFAAEHQADRSSDLDRMLVDAIVGKAPQMSCGIANQSANMVLDSRHGIRGDNYTGEVVWWICKAVNWLLKRCVFVAAAQLSQLIRIPICWILYCGCTCIGNLCEG